MLSISYGRAIDKVEANRHFNLVMKIKERWQTELKKLLQADPEALRYYCGKDEDFRNDLCFLFDKVTIDKLRKMMDDDTADGVVIFNGVRAKDDSKIPGTNNFSDTDGRPTLMIFPYKERTLDSLVGEVEIEIKGDDGYEHPGTGGKPGGLPNRSGIYEVPEVFELIEINRFR